MRRYTSTNIDIHHLANPGPLSPSLHLLPQTPDSSPPPPPPLSTPQLHSPISLHHCIIATPHPTPAPILFICEHGGEQVKYDDDEEEPSQIRMNDKNNKNAPYNDRTIVTTPVSNPRPPTPDSNSHQHPKEKKNPKCDLCECSCVPQCPQENNPTKERKKKEKCRNLPHPQEWLKNGKKRTGKRMVGRLTV
ncbi:hypothetical protein EX30DRAFT_57583 [Ascodesmis nigricans]|uniref:Uncharacterized protein n=1 Tax=Ascodesmis nigricans TaxID=341454 RepID=A0A4S2MUT5_9PEZI|nr:hypothetical protein EX30DRAFT_57583 [Ascodesmis nigricans]